MSEQRQRYLDSQEHKDAYAEHSRSNECAAEAAGAPGKCLLPLTPHHIAPRGAFGGQRAAEKFPVVTLCAYHNEWVQQDAYGREWAKAHYFHRDGQDWPFLMSPRDTFIYGTKVVEDL